MNCQRNLVNGRCHGHLLSTGAVRLTTITNTQSINHPPTINLPPNSENALRAYIPGAILNRLSAGQAGWLAELRRVTILFINLPDLTHTTPLEQGQAATRALQTALYRYEGSVNKISVDDKGATLVAALGLPPLAHEDDALRGVRAALDIASSLQKMQWSAAIGITTGRAFCGVVGNDSRREYTVIGDVVNLSARLMQATKQSQTTILCDEATFQATQTQIAFQSLLPITVKGKADAIPIYHPLHEASSHRIPTPTRQGAMIGRERERNQLTTSLQNLQQGQSGLIIIEGEAGIGKSRLVAELCQQADRLNITILLGAGDAIEKSAVYHPWRAIFWDLFGLDDLVEDSGQSLSRLSTKQRDHVLSQLGQSVPALAHLAPLLNAVLPLNLPDSDLTAQITGEARADNTNELLLGLLQAKATTEPLLLILEDAHWFDSTSWVLTRLVSREIAPLLLVIATRPLTEPFPREYKQLQQRPDTQHLLLNTLTPEETLQLICQRLGVTTLPQPVTDLLLEKGEGHPFFSEELAYALRDKGLIVIEDGRCQLSNQAGDLGRLDFPNTIDKVIISRIDLLSPSQQLTLKIASVIGRVFAFRTLQAIHPINQDKPHLSTYLTALEKLDLTPLENPDPDLSYIFKHIITQEVAYNLMAFAQRRQLHRAIAEWLEQTYADNLMPSYPLLAYHWRQALDEQHLDHDIAFKAIEYIANAGEQALENYANQEAIGFFEELLKLDDHLGKHASPLQRAGWERRLGEAFFKSGIWVEGRKHYEIALTLLNHPIPTNSSDIVINLLKETLKQTLYRLRLTKSLSVQQLPKEEWEIILEATKAFRSLTQIYFFREELVLFVNAGLASANLAERIGTMPALAQGFANLCASFGSVPIHSFAQAYGHRTMEIVQNIDDLSAKAWSILLTGYYYIGIGNWVEAEAILEQGSAICIQIGYRRHWDESQGLLGVISYRRGRFERSKKYFADIYASANRRGDVQPQIWGLTTLVENELWLGKDPLKLLPYLEESKNLLTAKNLSLAESIKTYGLLARVYLRMGNHELAQEEAQKTLELTEQVKSIILYSFEGYMAPAEVYLSLWESRGNISSAELQSISRFARRGLKIARKIGKTFPICEPRALFYQGRYDWLSGKHRKAYKAWQKSLALAGQLEMLHEQGLVYYEIGQHLPVTDPIRQEYLQRAADIFSQFEAAYDLTRTEKELAQK